MKPSARTMLSETLIIIETIHRAFGAPGDYGYNSAQGKALYALYKLTPDIHEALKRPEPAGPDASLEERLADILAEIVDRPLLTVHEHGRPLELFAGSFLPPEISDRAAELLEEAGR
jgi:hypothetical protein